MINEFYQAIIGNDRFFLDQCQVHNIFLLYFIFAVIYLLDNVFSIFSLSYVFSFLDYMFQAFWMAQFVSQINSSQPECTLKYGASCHGRPCTLNGPWAIHGIFDFRSITNLSDRVSCRCQLPITNLVDASSGWIYLLDHEKVCVRLFVMGLCLNAGWFSGITFLRNFLEVSPVRGFSDERFLQWMVSPDFWRFLQN